MNSTNNLSSKQMGTSTARSLVSTKRNPTQTIKIFDMPDRIILGFPEMPRSEDKTQLLVDAGDVITEVGDMEQLKLDATDGPYYSFNLRHHKESKSREKPVLGAMHMGQAYSAFHPQLLPMPPVGITLTIHPLLTPWQLDLISHYQFIRADVAWWVYIPCPLGAAPTIKAFMCEFDSTTEIRGVTWKPAAISVLGFHGNWSNDLEEVSIDSNGRLGQSGLSLRLKSIEDNSSESVNTPLQMTVYSCVYNIKCSGLRYNTNIQQLPALNFQPLPTTNVIPEEDPKVKYKEQIDKILNYRPPPITQAVPVEQKPLPQIKHTSEPDPSEQPVEISGETGTETHQMDEEPLTPALEQSVPESTPEVPKTKRPQTEATRALWFHLTTLTTPPTPTITWVPLRFDPRTMKRQQGESPGLIFRRMVWWMGKNYRGYVTCGHLQFFVSRPNHISGAYEVRDGGSNSSRYIVPFGSRTEIAVASRVHSENEVTATRPRNWLTYPMRTTQSEMISRHRLIGMNRTAEISHLRISIAFRMGAITAFSPTVPMTRQATKDNKYSKSLYEKIHTIDKSIPIFTHKMEHDDPERFIAPMGGDHPVVGRINFEHQEENLDQDSFNICVYTGKIKKGEVNILPLNLSNIRDINAPTISSTINQKFERFAHIIPASGGSLGPKCGTYTIHARLPATIAANIEHVSLPGDMLDEGLLRAFGLSSLIGLATSALTAIGGGNNSGYVNTIPNLIKSVLGVGGAPQNSQQNLNNPSTSPSTISGELPISRFVEFIKPVFNNFAQDPIFPVLLTKLVNFVTSDTGVETEAERDSVEIDVFLRMDNTHVARTVFDRTITPLNTFPNMRLAIPLETIMSVLQIIEQSDELYNPSSKVHQSFCKIIKYMQTPKLFATFVQNKYVYYDEIDTITISEDEHRKILQGQRDENLASLVF